MNYFLDNYTQWYTSFTINNHADIAFVPAIHKGEKKLANPLEVFSSSDWQLLGFSVLDPALVRRNEVIGRLGIKAHPSTEDLLHLFGTSPPTSEDQACQGEITISSDEAGVVFSPGQTLSFSIILY